MMVILLLLFLGSIQHSGSKPSTSNINMNNVKIKTKGSQHASAMTEQDTSGQCIQCRSKSWTWTPGPQGPKDKTLTCDGRKYDLDPCRRHNTRDGPNGCITVICDGRKVDLSKINPVSNDNDIRGQNGRNIDQNPNIQDFSGKLSKGQTIRDGQTCNRMPGITTMNWHGVCHRCRGTQHTRNNQIFCEGTEVDQNGRPIDQNQNNPVWPGNDIRGQNGRNIDQNPNVQDFSGQTIRDGQTFSQVQGPDGRGTQCANGVCHTCRGNQDIRNGKVFCDGKQVGTIDQNQNNPVWTGNDIRGQTIRGQDINQVQTGAGGKQCINGVCTTCRGININGKCHDRDANGLNFGDGNKQCFNGVCHTIDNQLNGKTVDQNQNNPVWTGNDIRGQTILGQDINQDQTNGFNSNTVRQGDHDHDHDHDLLGPGGKDYDNYDIKDWINWANTIKQLQLFEEKGGKPSAGGEKGGEP